MNYHIYKIHDIVNMYNENKDRIYCRISDRNMDDTFDRNRRLMYSNDKKENNFSYLPIHSLSTNTITIIQLTNNLIDVSELVCILFLFHHG